MINLYVAETSSGFNSLKLEIALLNASEMTFPEVFLGKPRTELELKEYLTSIFDDRNLFLLKEKTAVVCSTSEIVLDFFRILILDKRLSYEDFKCIFVDKKCNRFELIPDQDARFEWPAGFFTIHEQNLSRILEGRLK